MRYIMVILFFLLQIQGLLLPNHKKSITVAAATATTKSGESPKNMESILCRQLFSIVQPALRCV